MIPSAFCTLGFLTSYVGRNEQELYNDESNSIYLSDYVFWHDIWNLNGFIFYGRIYRRVSISRLIKPNEFV